jgi:predicted dehydrogenase
MKNINVGMIGFGYMGKMHTMCYDNLKYYYNTDVNVHMYAVSNTGKSSFPTQFQKIYSDYNSLINDENVDVVDICVPNFLHKEILIEAIKANKHIYCEKPLAIDIESANEIMEAYKKYTYNKTSRIAFEYRFVPAIIRAKQMINEGKIGKIINFNFKYYGSEFIDPFRPISWQSTKEKSGGGVLYALGTHTIDLIHYLIGDIDEVYADKRTYFKRRPLSGTDRMTDVDIEDIFNIQLYCGEKMGTLLLSQVAAGSGIDLAFEIYGEDGTIKFNHENPNVIYYYNNKEEKTPIGGLCGFTAIETTQKYGGAASFPPPRVNISWTRYHIASIFDFIDAVANNIKSYPNIEDGYKVQQVTDAIYRSAEEKKTIKIR